MINLKQTTISLSDVPKINWKALNAKRTKSINQVIDTYGPDILHTPDDTGLFPIHWAVIKGNVEIVDKMIKAGVSPRLRARVYDEPEPIHFAALEGNIKIIDLLVSHGIDIDVKDRTGCTPLIRASIFGKNIKTKASETVIHLISCGADVNQTDINGMNCLHYAVLNGNEETVHLLLNIGMDPNQRTNNGYRTIEFAVKIGNQYLMELLGPLTDGITETDLDYLISKHKKKGTQEKCTQFLIVLARIVLISGVFSAIFYAYPQYIFYYLPKTSSNIAIHIMLIMTNFLTLISWYKTFVSDPGYLPLNTKEYKEELKARVKSGLQTSFKPKVDFSRDIRLCHTCKVIQNHRSTHCRYCKRCIASFDHHCIYLSTCVGQSNRMPFFSLGLSLFFAGALSNYLVVSSAISENSLLTPYHWFNTCYTLQFAVVGGLLSICNLRRAALNLTLNEEFKSHKYSYLTDSEGRFVNPFDRGSYLKNIIDYFTTKRYNYSKLNTCEC